MCVSKTSWTYSSENELLELDFDRKLFDHLVAANYMYTYNEVHVNSLCPDIDVVFVLFIARSFFLLRWVHVIYVIINSYSSNPFSSM